MVNLKKLFLLLNKRKLFVMFLLIIIEAICEIVGLGLILPITYLLLNNDISKINFIPDWFKDYLERNLISIDLSLILLVLISIIILKNIVQIIYYYYESQYVWTLKFNVQKKIFSNFIKKKYNFFFIKKSSDIINIINNEISIFAHLIINCLYLISDLIILIFISSLFLFYNFQVYSVLFISLIFLIFFFYFILKKNMESYGNKRNFKEVELTKLTQEAFFGIKDIKIYKAENFIEKIFYKCTDSLKKLFIYNSFILRLPKPIIEILALIICFVTIILIFYFYNLKFSNLEILSFLGLLIAGMIRVLPAAKRVFSSIQFYKLNSNVINIIFKSADNYFPDSENKKIQKKIFYFKNIKIENLCYCYPGEKKYIFYNANLLIRRNNSVGIYSESGSGKSTFVNLLSGLLEPTAGNILADGVNINDDLNDWRENIGYVSQKPFFTNSTILENIGFGLYKKYINKKRIDALLEFVDLKDLINRLPKKIYTKVGENGIKFSGGESQRIAIARALYFNPSLLIFDESTNSLDFNVEKNILEKIYKIKNKTLIIISHKLENLKHCDVVYKIAKKKFFKLK